MKVFNEISIFFGFIGTFLGMLIGTIDGFLYTLIVFVVIDYITGVLVAISQKKISSQIGFKGICKKTVIFILIMIANMIDCNLIKDGGIIRTTVIFFYLSNEGISILENADKLGVRIPHKLRTILKQLDKDDKRADDVNDKQEYNKRA
ncbi:MAG: phage holin family protein [Acidithiobacillus sp.]|jgi:toxin secretion/phage lysis holin|uniref:phage holin family protein n=1 Tax=Acidithiobacillus sp. TaxID=1872118 RepID=UPI00355EBEF3